MMFAHSTAMTLRWASGSPRLSGPTASSLRANTDETRLRFLLAAVRSYLSLRKIAVVLYALWLRFRTRKPVVVLYRQAGLGDVIYAITVYREISKLRPDLSVLFVTTRPYDVVLRASSDVRYSFALSTPYVPGRALRALGIPVYTPLGYDERAEFSHLNEANPPLNPQPPNYTTMRLSLAGEFQKTLGLPLNDAPPFLWVSRSDQERARQRFRIRDDEFVIVIHSGRTWPVKELHPAIWQELIDGIQDRFRCRILHLCSPATCGGEELLRHHFTGVESVSLPLDAMMGLLCVAQVFIGLDSGPTHLAAALRVPVAAFFGPTNPAYFLPRSSLTLGITHPVPCLFCHHRDPVLHWRTNCPFAIRCLHELSTQDALRAIVQFWSAVCPELVKAAAQPSGDAASPEGAPS